MKPVSASFKFSITYAFGSICLGSLIVAILKTFRLIVRMIATTETANDNEICRFINYSCICVLLVIENALQYFNEWAYAYVSMYRYDFRTCAKMVWDLWSNNGWEVVSNDMYTDMVTFVPPIVTGLVVAGLYAMSAKYIALWDSASVIIGAIVGGVLGFMLCNMVMRLIGTVQNVIFLSYLEQREIFKKKHPTFVASLEEKFQHRYPSILLSEI